MLFTIGWLIAMVGVIWMVVTAIQTGQTTGEKVIWAIVCLIGCNPIGSAIFFIVKRQGLVPLLLQIVGIVIMFLSGGMSAYMGGLTPATTP